MTFDVIGIQVYSKNWWVKNNPIWVILATQRWVKRGRTSWVIMFNPALTLKWTKIKLGIKPTNLTHKEWLLKGKYLSKTTRENGQQVTCMLRRNAEKYGINSYRVYKWSIEHLLNITFKIKFDFFGTFLIVKFFTNYSGRSTQINHNINTDIITFNRSICVWNNVSMCINYSVNFVIKQQRISI